MVEMQILNNRNGYFKQYVVTDHNCVVIITTDMTKAYSIKKEIEQKENHGNTKDKQ